jgi:hypothetical protein
VCQVGGTRRRVCRGRRTDQSVSNARSVRKLVRRTQRPPRHSGCFATSKCAAPPRRWSRPLDTRPLDSCVRRRSGLERWRTQRGRRANRWRRRRSRRTHRRLEQRAVPVSLRGEVRLLRCGRRLHALPV